MLITTVTFIKKTALTTTGQRGWTDVRQAFNIWKDTVENRSNPCCPNAGNIWSNLGGREEKLCFICIIQEQLRSRKYICSAHNTKHRANMRIKLALVQKRRLHNAWRKDKKQFQEEILIRILTMQPRLGYQLRDIAVYFKGFPRSRTGMY